MSTRGYGVLSYALACSSPGDFDSNASYWLWNLLLAHSILYSLLSCFVSYYFPPQRRPPAESEGNIDNKQYAAGRKWWRVSLKGFQKGMKTRKFAPERLRPPIWLYFEMIFFCIALDFRLSSRTLNYLTQSRKITFLKQCLLSNQPQNLALFCQIRLKFQCTGQHFCPFLIIIL